MDLCFYYNHLNCKVINPRLTKVPPPREFFHAAQKSDQSHLSNINYILCGYLDETNKNRGYPFRWGKPSKMAYTEGGCQMEKKAPFCKISAYYATEFTEYVRITISLLYKPKPRCEIPIFRTFLEKF